MSCNCGIVGFADADGSNLVRFDERDRVALRRQEAGANGRREPPSSASADHKNSKRSLAHRGSLIRTIQKEMAARQIEHAAIQTNQNRNVAPAR